MGVSQILKTHPWMKEIPKMFVDMATNTGLSLSIYLLCIHLIVFATVDDLRNLPDKNLASFSLALLLEYSSTLISGVFLNGTACYVNEIAAYYFIMASAFWMLTMSYDVWQRLRSSSNELLVISGRQSKKFVLYSLWSWLMPALLTVLVFFVLPRNFENFDYALKDFDRERCTFKETDEMYIFIVSVFGTILLLNTFFFASSVYYIHSTQSAVTRRSGNMTTKRYFQRYARLSIIMGVTWTVEFVVHYAEFDILNATFKIINTLEGLFIVVAFTARKETSNAVKSLHLFKTIQNPKFNRYMNLRMT